MDEQYTHTQSPTDDQWRLATKAQAAIEHHVEMFNAHQLSSTALDTERTKINEAIKSGNESALDTLRK